MHVNFNIEINFMKGGNVLLNDGKLMITFVKLPLIPFSAPQLVGSWEMQAGWPSTRLKSYNQNLYYVDVSTYGYEANTFLSIIMYDNA